MKNDQLRVATVFSGIGAFEYSLKRANIDHQIIFACDIDKYVKKSYFTNYEISYDCWYDNISDIDGKKYEDKVDIFVGGSPCQPFSVAGNQEGFSDPRGQLFYDFIRLIHEIKPSVFIYENVKAIMNNNNGDTWDKISEGFTSTGYHWKYEVLNSKDYGIPQSRSRVFIVGFKNVDDYSDFSFMPPLALKLKLQNLLEDHFNENMHMSNDLYDMSKDFNLIAPFYIKDPIKIDDRYFLSHKLMRYVTATNIKNFNNKLDLDPKIAKTLVATMHKMHRTGIDNYITYGARLRRLTPRECLRLMGFDDRFKIVVSDTQMYRQAGNSIVVDVLIGILIGLKYDIDSSYQHILSIPVDNRKTSLDLFF